MSNTPTPDQTPMRSLTADELAAEFERGWIDGQKYVLQLFDAGKLEERHSNDHDLDHELCQVAAVAMAIVTDLRSGSTQMHQPDGTLTDHHRDTLASVLAERMRQEKTWGSQHHPIQDWLAILLEEVGEAAKAALDTRIFPKAKSPRCR